MSLSFRKWREMALTEYPVVSDKYYKKVYENIATDPQTGESILVQLTLQGVLDKCEGTNFELPYLHSDWWLYEYKHDLYDFPAHLPSHMPYMYSPSCSTLTDPI